MDILNRMIIQQILDNNWLFTVLFFGSIPYFSYSIIEISKKFPNISNKTKNVTFNSINSGEIMSILELSCWVEEFDMFFWKSIIYIVK